MFSGSGVVCGGGCGQPGVWLLKDLCIQPKGEGVLYPLKRRPGLLQTEQG